MPIGQLDPEIPQIGRCPQIETITGIERPDMSGLLIIEGTVQFSLNTPQPAVVHVPDRGRAYGSVHQGLHGIDIDRVDLAPTMLRQRLDREIKMKRRLGIIRLQPRREANRKGLLMGIALKNEALPVYPEIHIEHSGIEK